MYVRRALVSCISYAHIKVYEHEVEIHLSESLATPAANTYSQQMSRHSDYTTPHSILGTGCHTMPYQNCQTHQCLVKNSHLSQEKMYYTAAQASSGVKTVRCQILKPQSEPVKPIHRTTSIYCFTKWSNQDRAVPSGQTSLFGLHMSSSAQDLPF